MSYSIRRAVYFVITLSFFLNIIPLTSVAGSWNGWIYQDPYPTSVNLFDVKFVTSLKGWITGKYGTVLYTEDAGENWEVQESGIEEDIMRVAFVNEKTGWAAGKSGTIIHTEDGGKKWVKQFNIKALPTKLFFINEKEGWVTGSSPMGVVYHTIDSGKTWQKMETGIQRAIASVYFFNSQTGWILAGEEIYRTADGGKKWEKSKLPASLPSPGPRSLGRGPTAGTFEISPVEGLGPEWWFGGISFIDEKQGWAVVNQGNVFYSGDGGKTWTTQLDTGYGTYGFSHVSFRDAQNGCVSGSTIYCTEDGGKVWKERLGVRPGAGIGLGGVSLVGRVAGWVAGNDGRILKTEDSGTSWKDPSKWNECGRVLLFINKATGWLYSPRSFNKLCRTDDGGHTWEKQEVGIRVREVFFVDDLTGWAVGTIEEWKDGKESNASYNRINAWGVIQHTSDGGKTWKTQYKEAMNTRGGFPGLTGITFINSDQGWAVGIRGTILHTEDGGKHWAHQKSGNVKFNLHRVQFMDSNTGYVTGTQVSDGWTGIILYTEDSGKQWKVQHKLRDTAFYDLSLIDKKSAYVSGHSESGKVGVLLHTDDGGKTWSKKEFENIGNNRMTFLDRKQGVIYSENGSILTTNDGGKTWTRRRIPFRKYPWHASELFEKDK